MDRALFLGDFAVGIRWQGAILVAGLCFRRARVIYIEDELNVLLGIFVLARRSIKNTG